jgi:hypothetical protein
MIGTNRLAAIFFEVRLSDSPRTGAFLVDSARIGPWRSFMVPPHRGTGHGLGKLVSYRASLCFVAGLNSQTRDVCDVRGNC